MIELVPLALVITVSPASIIPAVLLLHTPQPRPSGLAYLAGWLLGLGGLTAVCIGVSSMLGGVRLHAPEGKPWLRIAIGIALIAFGAGRYLTRHGRDGLPGRMQPLHKVTPARAGRLCSPRGGPRRPPSGCWRTWAPVTASPRRCSDSSYGWRRTTPRSSRQC